MLESYRKLNHLLDAELDKLAHLRSANCKCTTTITGMPTQRGGADNGNLLARMADQADYVAALWARLQEMQTRIDKSIYTIPDKRARAMLRDRYIYGYSLRKLSRAYQVRHDTVKQILTSAIEQIVLDK